MLPIEDSRSKFPEEVEVRLVVIASVSALAGDLDQQTEFFELGDELVGRGVSAIYVLLDLAHGDRGLFEQYLEQDMKRRPLPAI